MEAGLMEPTGEGRPLLTVQDLESRMVFTKCKVSKVIKVLITLLRSLKTVIPKVISNRNMQCMNLHKY